MKNREKLYSLALASITIISLLILISSIGGLASNVQNASSGAPYAHVTNHDSKNILCIDTTTNNVTAAISVGDDPLGVAVSLDGTKRYMWRALLVYVESPLPLSL